MGRQATGAGHAGLATAICAVALLAACVLALFAGKGALLGEQSEVYLNLRGARSACAALAGAALAVSGALVQGLFRNPLASPSVLGTTAGAALGGQLVLLGHAGIIGLLPAWLAPEMALPIGCLLGAWLALSGVSAVARLVARDGAEGTAVVLLAGVIVGSFLASLSAFATWLGGERWDIGRALVAFALGSVDAKGWVHVALASPLVLAGCLAAWGWGRHLDLLLSGEDEAQALGCDVRSARRWVLTWSAVLAGAAVAVGGSVAFVGLVVPHALRPFTGPEHRRLIPASALGGAAFLVACDALCRLTPGGELPLGVLTGFIGAPVFALLLLKGRKEGWI